MARAPVRRDDAILLRPCGAAEADSMLAVVNAAAVAYRGAIPDAFWREPYMPAEELAHALAAGVRFHGAEAGGALAGVMGVQSVGEIDVIRHAYVAPERQGQGLGGALIGLLVGRSRRPILVGTWAAATWAVRFYRRHGFRLLAADEAAELLPRYWRDVSAAQAAVSVVLALDETPRA